MATTKAPSVEAILDALRRHPDSTATELAEAAGIGRSTASKALVVLEAEGYATRRRSTPPTGAKNAPELWTLISPAPAAITAAPHGEPTPEAEPTGRRPAPEQPATTPAEAGDQPGDTRKSQAATSVPSETGETTTIDTGAMATPPAANEALATGPRLRPGELRGLIHAYLTERAGQELTPTKIGKDLGRSAGAVGNALATMTEAGEVTQTSTKPRRYAITSTPQPAKAS